MRFEALIDRYHDEIHSYLWHLMTMQTDGGSVVTAEDLTQEVFLRAYRAYGRLRAGSNYRAWLYRIATNCARTAFSRNRRDSRHIVDLPDDESTPLLADDDRSPVRQAIHNERLVAIRHAIRNLPPTQQAALIMRYLQGLEYPEIAAVLGCSEDSVRANVYQAIRRLRQVLNAEGME